MTVHSADAAETMPHPSLLGIVATLGRAHIPLELDRLPALRAAAAAAATEPVAFRFCLDEVPFRARAERRDGRLVVVLEGELGVMPFTIEGARRRRRLRQFVRAAGRASGLEWTVDDRQRILVNGTTAVDMPLTPAGVMTGTVALLLRLRPYLALAIEIASEAEAPLSGAAEPRGPAPDRSGSGC